MVPTLTENCFLQLRHLHTLRLQVVVLFVYQPARGANGAVRPTGLRDFCDSNVLIGVVTDGFEECFWGICRAFHTPTIAQFGEPTTLLP